MIGTSWNVSSVRPSKSNHGTQTVPGARVPSIPGGGHPVDCQRIARFPPGKARVGDMWRPRRGYVQQVVKYLLLFFMDTS